MLVLNHLQRIRRAPDPIKRTARVLFGRREQVEVDGNAMTELQRETRPAGENKTEIFCRGKECRGESLSVLRHALKVQRHTTDSRNPASVGRCCGSNG